MSPLPAGDPTITGEPAAGRTLACVNGGFLNEPTSYEYAWLRNGVPIAGRDSRDLRHDGERPRSPAPVPDHGDQQPPVTRTRRATSSSSPAGRRVRPARRARRPARRVRQATGQGPTSPAARRVHGARPQGPIGPDRPDRPAGSAGPGRARPAARCWCPARSRRTASRSSADEHVAGHDGAHPSTVRLVGTRRGGRQGRQARQGPLRISSKRIARTSRVVVRVTIRGRSARMSVPLGKQARLALKKR